MNATDPNVVWSTLSRVDAACAFVPDDLGIVHSEVLAYGFTPKSVAAARRVLTEVMHRNDVLYLALDVGTGVTTPPCASTEALLRELRELVVDRSVITVAMPHGSPSGLALAFCLGCNVSTLDGGAMLLTGRDTVTDPQIRWSLGQFTMTGLGDFEAISAEDALGLKLVDVLVTPDMRLEAVRTMAGERGRRHLSSHALYKSLAIARNGHDRHASA